ncbi:lipoprotein ABC transporter permease [Brachyspira pilosicoli]|uniref:lipoprotein ABC transporter permease n=1 Tax=Brachyspira pilosicoli TaxID=52584 RepID=UPI0030048616
MKKKVIFCVFISFIASLILYFNLSNKKTYSNYTSIMNTNYMAVRDEAPPEYFIDNYSEKKDNLSKVFDEREVSAVLKYKALIISYLGEEEIVLNGVENNNIFDINISKKSNGVIISEKTSKNLNIEIGDSVILKLITKDGHYNAEEYEVLTISDALKYNYALVDIDNLNNFVKLNDCASEVYIRNNSVDENIVKQVFGDGFGYYSLNEKTNNNNNLYFILAYFFIVFFSFIFVNNNNLFYSVIFSIIGFILSLAAYFIIMKYILKNNFYFDKIYLIVLLVNIVSVLSAKLKVFSIKKMFLESVKFSNLLILFGFIIVYVFAFVVSYDYLLETAQKRTSSNNNVYNIAKKNTSDNTFLLNGSIGDINIINNDVSRVISFPVGVVIRTGSIQSKVYAYDNLNIKYNILSGEMFEGENKEIVIGKHLARYLNIKVGDSVSLIAKNSRSILDTMYFKVVGIYDIDNYNIYANLKTMYDFLHLRGGDKTPYNEKIIIQSDDNIYSYLNKKLKDNNLDELYIEGYDDNNNIKIFSFIFMGLFLISVSLFNSFLLSVFCKASNINNINKNDTIKRYAISFIISIILSLILILLLYDIVFNFIIFLVIIFILSFALTVISLLGSDI